MKIYKKLKKVFYIYIFNLCLRIYKRGNSLFTNIHDKTYNSKTLGQREVG